MSQTPNYDAKVKAILDTTTPGERTDAVTSKPWVMTARDVEMFRQFNVPPLAIHPETFLKQMIALHTGFSWWWNIDVATGKPIITNVHPHTEFQVMNDEAWHQEDFIKCGREVVKEESFFDQFYALLKTVPISAQKNIEKSVNSISRHSFGDEDSYFVEGSISKRCYYMGAGFHAEDSAIVTYSQQIFESYDVSHSANLHHCVVARESRDCINCSFVFDCRDCENCFLSANQRHKKFLFRDEQLTEAEWHARMKEVDLGDYRVFDALKQEFMEKMATRDVWPENFNDGCENVNGEYLNKCVNAERTWFSDGASNVRWSIWGNFTSEHNALGIDVASTHCYGNAVAINSSDCRFCYFATRCQQCEYCFETYDCENCFGCVGLKRKKFCIFNKQYSEEEYWIKLDEIKCAMLERGEYGQMFPQRFALTPFEHSPFKTVFAATPEIKAAIGVRDYDAGLDGAFGNWEGKEMADVDSLPLHINDVGDEWIGRAVLDKALNRPFAFLAPEIAFYRRMHLPLRRGHFVAQVEEMLFSLNMFEQMLVSCACCGREITASKNVAYPSRKIFCRDCYLRHLDQQP